MGQIQFTISLVMIGLFALAVVSFGVGFASDNNAAIDLADDPTTSLLTNQIESNLSSLRTGSSNTYDSIIESAIDQGDTTQSGGAFAITPVNAAGVVKSVVKSGYIKIFGTDSSFGIVITTFIAMISFIFGLYIWKTWAGRLPD